MKTLLKSQFWFFCGLFFQKKFYRNFFFTNFQNHFSPRKKHIFVWFFFKFISLISAFQRTRSQLKRVKRARTGAHTVPESLIFAVIKVFTTRSSYMKTLLFPHKSLDFEDFGAWNPLIFSVLQLSSRCYKNLETYPLETSRHALKSWWSNSFISGVFWSPVSIISELETKMRRRISPKSTFTTPP